MWERFTVAPGAVDLNATLPDLVDKALLSQQENGGEVRIGVDRNDGIHIESVENGPDIASTLVSSGIPFSYSNVEDPLPPETLKGSISRRDGEPKSIVGTLPGLDSIRD